MNPLMRAAHLQRVESLAAKGRIAIIDRVAKAIWSASKSEGLTVSVCWEQAVIDATHPKGHPALSERVRITIAEAKAAIAAIRPPEPCFDEDVALAVSLNVEAGGDAVIVISHVEAWIDEVLK